MIKYKHMFGIDLELWERFLRRHGKYYSRFDYDVRVGRGIVLPAGYPPNIAGMAKALTQKRIDAVGYHNEEVWLIEIKPDAGLSALGQLLAYKLLYTRDVGVPKRLYLAVVTDILNPDERYLFDKNEVRYYIV